MRVSLQKLIIQKDPLVMNCCEAPNCNLSCFLKLSYSTECTDRPVKDKIYVFNRLSPFANLELLEVVRLRALR